MKIVRLLNDTYTRLDQLIDPKTNPNVYKVMHPKTNPDVYKVTHPKTKPNIYKVMHPKTSYKYYIYTYSQTNTFGSLKGSSNCLSPELRAKSCNI